MSRARTPRRPVERPGALWRWLGRSDHVPGLSSAAFAHPLDRASQAPHRAGGHIVERDVRFERYLRQLTKHAPTESAPRWRNDGRAVAFLPFHREAMPVSLPYAPHNVDAARAGRECPVFARIGGKLVESHAERLGRCGLDP